MTLCASSPQLLIKTAESGAQQCFRRHYARICPFCPQRGFTRRRLVLRVSVCFFLCATQHSVVESVIQVRLVCTGYDQNN